MKSVVYDPAAASGPSYSQLCMELPTDMALEQVDSLLSSNQVSTATTSTCSQLPLDFVSYLAHEPSGQADTHAFSDCSIDAALWAAVPDTTAALEQQPITTGTVEEPSSAHVEPFWASCQPAHVDMGYQLPAVTCNGIMQHVIPQWETATGYCQSSAGTSTAAAAVADVQPMAGSSSSLWLVADGSTEAAGPAAAAARSPVEDPPPAKTQGESSRLKANKLAQRRQRQRKQGEVERLTTELAVMKSNQDSMHSRLESVRSENVSLLCRLSDITGKWQQTVALNASLQQENTQHKAELAELKQQLNAMQAQLQEQQEHWACSVGHPQQHAACWSNMELVGNMQQQQLRRW